MIQRAPYPHRHEVPTGALRLQLARRFGATSVDGVWWPHGSDLVVEGAQLVDCFPRQRGVVDRVGYHPRDWADAAPEQIYTQFGRTKIGPIPDVHRGFVLVRLTHVPLPTILRLRLVRSDFSLPC